MLECFPPGWNLKTFALRCARGIVSVVDRLLADGTPLDTTRVLLAQRDSD